MPPRPATATGAGGEHHHSDPLASAAVQASLFAHVTTVPPHGPFAYLSALTASVMLLEAHPQHEADVLAPGFGVTQRTEVTPQRVLDFYQRQWNVDHLRAWPALYAAAAAPVSGGGKA